MKIKKGNNPNGIFFNDMFDVNHWGKVSRWSTLHELQYRNGLKDRL